MPWILRNLPYLVYGMLGAFLIGWLVLLIACSRKKRFWPVLPSQRASKIFWLAMLLLVNPALTALYLIFGQIRRPDAHSARGSPLQVATAAVLIAVAGFLVNFPGLTHLWMVPFLGQGRGDEEGLRLEAHAATIEARNNTSSTVTSYGDRSGVACRRVAIIQGRDDVLTHRIAGALRAEVARLPFVEEVKFQTDGRFPPSGTVRPDVFVMVNIRNVRVTPIPYAVGLSAQIDVAAGFREFPSENQSLEFEVGLDEPAALFQIQPDGKPRVAALTVLEPPGGPRPPADTYTFRYVEASEEMRTHEEQSFPVNGRWEISRGTRMGAILKLVETDQKSRFRATVQAVASQPANPQPTAAPQDTGMADLSKPGS